jgi:hypothetical protein
MPALPETTFADNLISCGVPSPDEQNAESVDERDQEHLRQHGIAQAHRGGEPPAFS